jgi:hypothetical protein
MEYITTIIVSFTALITGLCSLIVAVKKIKKEVEDTLPKRIKKQSSIDIEIINRMEEVKELLGADRVQIYEFHNGVHYANGRSALKVSCSYEVCRVGIKACQMYLQSIPLSCIPQFIKKLLNENEMKVNDLREIKEQMPATYALKSSQNVASYYDVVLNNKDQEPIGFLAIQYTKINKINFNDNENNAILKLKFFIEENLEEMTTNKK